MTEESYDSLQAWIASRPESVQLLARKYPLGTQVILEGIPHYLLGYTEGDHLILSATNPALEYAKAIANPIFLCEKHLK